MLKLGKMKGQELAQWMNISYSTYKRCPAKYISRLDDYCIYEKIRGGVIIKEIFIYKYNKNLKAEQTKIYLAALKENNNIISLSGLEKTTGLSTYQSRQIRNKLFGEEPININPEAHGLIGFRERIWAIKIDENQYRNFTKEEEELFDILIQQNYIDKMTPEAVKAQQLILDCCVKEGYTAEKYQEILTERKYNFFNDVINRFRELTGYQIGSPTKHTVAITWSWECPEEEEEYKEYLYKIIAELENTK